MLDDPISEYFPEWRETRKYVKDIDGTYQICQAERAIQIRHIMSMSCGLPYGHMPDDTPTGKEIYRVTEELKREGIIRCGRKSEPFPGFPSPLNRDHIGCTALAVNWQPG